MREGRVIALAGLFQALALVRAIAQRGVRETKPSRSCQSMRSTL